MSGTRIRAPLALGCIGTFFLCLFANSARGDEEIPVLDVYRMLQYDTAEQHLGSRKTPMNMIAVPPSAYDASKSAVVVDFSQLTEAKLNDILVTKKASGLLIILPAPGEPVDPKIDEQWRRVESSLISREIPIPVYLAFDGEQARQLKAAVERNAGDTQLVVDTHSPTKASGETAQNFQALLDGTGESGSSEPSKIIAVVANTDSLALAPELAVGADANGSGMAAVLQLARMFHKLYSSSRMQGKSSLLFVLTAAGKLDYAGTKHWLSSTDPRILDRIDFALCLDSIGGVATDPDTRAPTLYLHSSKPAKDPSLTRVTSVLNASAAAEGIALGLVHKKINISDPSVAWEHEQFSRKRVLAVTLSRHASHAAHLRASVLDRAVDKEALRKNVGVIANALARAVFDMEDVAGIFEGSYGINVPFLEAWAEVAASEGRMAGHQNERQRKADKGATLVDKVEAVMKEIAADDHKQTFTLDASRTFYVNGNAGKMSVYTVRPISFDLGMAVVVAAYLLSLLVLLQGWEDAKETLKGLMPGKAKGRNQKRA